MIIDVVSDEECCLVELKTVIGRCFLVGESLLIFVFYGLIG